MKEQLSIIEAIKIAEKAHMQGNKIPQGRVTQYNKDTINPDFERTVKIFGIDKIDKTAEVVKETVSYKDGGSIGFTSIGNIDKESIEDMAKKDIDIAFKTSKELFEENKEFYGEEEKKKKEKEVNNEYKQDLKKHKQKIKGGSYG